MTTKKAKVDLTRKVSIRQYVDPEVFNMGLEQYGLSVFSGETGMGGHREWLGYKQIGNTYTYLTGLDPQADYITKISDEEERAAVQAQVKEMRSFLESRFGKETLNANNVEFWSQISLNMNVPVKELDLSNVSDLIVYCAIKAGGFSEIAPSYAHAKESNKIYKFYLHEEEEVMSLKVEVTKLRNRAKAKLEDIYDSDFEHMFLLAKTFLPVEKGYNRRTPLDTMYNEINVYIEGAGLKEKSLKQLTKTFIDLANTDKAELRYKALVKEAIYQKIITKDSSNKLVNSLTTNTLGGNEADIIEYLKNPLHQEDLISLSDAVNKIWK